MKIKMSVIMPLIVAATYIYSSFEGKTVPKQTVAEKIIPEQGIYESGTTAVSAVSKALPEKTISVSEQETVFQISEVETNRYTFKRAKPQDLLEQCQRLEEQYGNINEAYICSLINQDYYTERDQAPILGQIWALFGEPDDPALYGDLYSYAVSAEDREGNIMYLYVYQASGTPSVGGPVGEEFQEYKEAAEELAELILRMKPADYEWGGIYEDFGINIKYYVKYGISGYADDWSALEEFFNKYGK
ncbi:MAG: hypothetical protein NC086_09070 [Alistipes sp.]|nr:hypothetical protein [Alistipes sp.]